MAEGRCTFKPEGKQQRWRDAAIWRILTVAAKERDTTAEEADRGRAWCHAMKPLGVGAGKHERNTVAMVGEAVEPEWSLVTVGRIEPDAAVPRLRETVIRERVEPLRWNPRQATSRGAGVKIERQR